MLTESQWANMLMDLEFALESTGLLHLLHSKDQSFSKLPYTMSCTTFWRNALPQQRDERFQQSPDFS